METKTHGVASLSARFAAALLAVALFQGCASSGYQSVPRSTAGRVQTVDTGTVVAVNSVTIDGEKTILGTTGGGIIGSAVGQTVAKSNDGRILAGAVGAVAGAVVGREVEEALTRKRAQEVTVNMDDGRTVVVVQEVQEPAFIVGDRVKVMETRMGEARISHSDFAEDGLYQSSSSH